MSDKEYARRKRKAARRERPHPNQTTNHNYSINIKPARIQTTYRSTGTVESVVVTDQEHRAAALTVNNPWRQLKPAKLTPTARTLNHWRRIAGMCSITTSGPGGRKVITTGPHVEPIVMEWNRRYLSPTYHIYDEQLRTEAILEALQAVKDQKWNAGIVVAEMSGVIQMGYDAMNLVVRTRNAIRKAEYGRAYEEFRSKVKKAKPYPTWRRENWQQLRHIKSIRESKHIPTGWLYYHFGIKPTLDDISDGVAAYGSRLADLAYSGALFTKGYAKQTTKITENLSRSSYSGTMEHNVLRSVRVIIGVRPKNFVAGKLSELGVTNPPEAVYNAIPFSWLVDYFTSFGDWLSVLDTSLGWTFDEFWQESWRVVASSVFTPVSSSTVKYGYPTEPCRIDHKNINRKVRGDLYGPMGSILPQFKRRGPSLQQVSNLLSVLSTSMRVPIRP